MNKANNEQIQICDEWNRVNEQLAELKSREADLRKQLLEICFPEVQEGSGNKLELTDGFIVQATGKINRSLDEEQFLASKNQLAKDGFDVEALTKTKVSLNESNFKKLKDEQKHIFAQFVTEKPGSSSVKIVKPKRGVK